MGYEIGYRRPPDSGRFKKGKSGNPKGRPKGHRNLSSIMMDAARDQVTATIDGTQRKISKIQATAMQLATKAAGGDQAAADSTRRRPPGLHRDRRPRSFRTRRPAPSPAHRAHAGRGRAPAGF